VYQEPGALDMSEEGVSAARAAMRSFYQARQIGYHKANTFFDTYDPQIWHQSSKRIIGDLRPGRRDPGYQAGLADVRKAEHTNVGQELQLEGKTPSLPGLALLGEPRGAARRRRKLRIAAPTAAAAGDHHALPRSHEVRDDAPVLSILDHGPDGETNLDIGPVFAALALGTAAAAVLGAIMPLMCEVNEGPKMSVGHGD